MRKATTVLGVLAAAVVLSATPGGAQTADGLDITSVDAAGYPAVTAVVTAPPGLGGAAYPTSAFQVTEDGHLVDYTVQRVPTSNLEIMLVVDTSGSMVGAPIEAARAAADEFLTVLPADTRVGVVAFGSQPSLIAGPTTDRALLSSGVAQLTASGETALYDAVSFATSQFTADASDRAIVLLSDGGDTASTTTLDQAAAGGVRTDVIELVTGESNSAVLGQLAAAGGGSVSSVADPAALAGLYRSAAASLANQYRVGYKSSSHGAVPLTVRVATGAGVLEATTDVDLPAAAAPAAPTSSSSGRAARADGARPEPEQIALIVGAAGIFLALVLLSLVGLSVDRRNRKARAQLGVERSLVSGPGITHMADRMTAAADGYLERHNRRRTLAAALEAAAISLRPGEFIVLVGIATMVAGLAGLALGGPLFGIVLVALVPLAARFVVGHLAERRREKFAEQLPDTLQLLTSTLQIGLRPAPGARQRGPGVRGTGPHRVPAGTARDPGGTRPVGRAPRPLRPHAQRGLRLGGRRHRDQPGGRRRPGRRPREHGGHDPGAPARVPADASPHRRGTPLGVHPHRAAGRRGPRDEVHQPGGLRPAHVGHRPADVGRRLRPPVGRVVLDEDVEPDRVLMETFR